MSGGVLAVRLFLAAMFLVAAISKLSQLEETRGALAVFGLPSRLQSPGALVLPIAECAVTLLLLPTATAQWGAGLAALLLLIFAVAIVRLLVRGRHPDCNCFGALHSRPISGWMAARNIALAALAAGVTVRGPGTAIGSLINGAGLMIAGAAMLTAIVAANGWFSWHLLKQNGRMLTRLRALEVATAMPEASSVPTESLEGRPAPQFALPTTERIPLSLDELLAPGLPLALIFSDPDCAGCVSLAKRLPRIQEELSGSLEIAMITQERAGGATDRLLDDSSIPTLLQKGWEVARQYHVAAVPSAVLVSVDRTIASPVATGGDAVERLLSSRRPSELGVQVLRVAGVNG